MLAGNLSLLVNIYGQPFEMKYTWIHEPASNWKNYEWPKLTAASDHVSYSFTVTIFLHGLLDHLFFPDLLELFHREIIISREISTLSLKLRRHCHDTTLASWHQVLTCFLRHSTTSSPDLSKIRIAFLMRSFCCREKTEIRKSWNATTIQNVKTQNARPSKVENNAFHVSFIHL